MTFDPYPKWLIESVVRATAAQRPVSRMFSFSVGDVGSSARKVFHSKAQSAPGNHACLSSQIRGTAQNSFCSFCRRIHVHGTPHSNQANASPPYFVHIEWLAAMNDRIFV